MEKIADGVWKLSFGLPEEHTPVRLRERDDGRSAKIRDVSEAAGCVQEILSGAGDKLSLMEENISIKQTGRGIVITLPMASSEDIYGFGLQLLSSNFAGRRRYCKVNSDPKVDTGESHAPVPFYISTAGYGLLVDTFRYAAFYMGTTTVRGASADKKEVNQPHEEFSESALYALKRAKEQRRVIIEIPAAQGIDLYFFAGTPGEVVQRYNLFCGGGCLPPMWGLGVWYRTYGGSDETHVKKLASLFREEKMPVDVIGLEPGWHSHSYSCTYEWGYLFPKPEDMLSELSREGYHVNLWEHAYVYPASPIYEALTEYSGDYEVWNGLVPDFSLTETCEIFADWHSRNFIEKGVGGFKLDECDNSDFNPSNWGFPDSTLFPSGMDGEQMHSAIGVLYQRMMRKAYRKANIRTLSQVRSSGAMASNLPFVLYSDLYNHRDFIRGMVTASFSGLLWAPEVRDCRSGEDLLRRVETAVFSPQALLNCWRIPSPPWKQVDIDKNLRGEEMETAEYYTDACRRLFELRVSLLPYLYSAFVEYDRKGIPPIRHMVLDYPEDLQVRNIDDQYFFGKDLLVCPLVLEDGTERSVYLPEGEWYDFFTGERIESRGRFTVQAEWEQIPVFVRGGSVVPLAKPVQCVREGTVFEMTVRTFGTGTGSFTLYEDDFTTWNYEKEGFTEIVIESSEDGRIQISGERDSEKYSFKGLEK